MRHFPAYSPLVPLLMLTACAGSPPPEAPEPAASQPQTHSSAEPPSSDAAEPAQSGLSTTSVFAVHQVADLDAYRAYLAGSQEARDEAGVVAYLLSQGQGPEKRVVVHFVVQSKDKLDAFLASDEADSLLDKPGAPDSSLLWQAHDVAIEVPAALPEQTFGLFSKFPVQDFSEYRTAFLAAVPQLKEAGVVAYGLHRSVLDGNVVILHLIAADPAALTALKNNEKLSPIVFAGPDGAPDVPLIVKDLLFQRRTP